MPIQDTHYQSKYAGYKIVMKPGRKKEVQGEIIELPGERIKFTKFVYVPKTEKEEKFLDAQIAKGNNKIWKVTKEAMLIAKKNAQEIAELKKKQSLKQAENDKITGEADKIKTNEPTHSKGLSSTGNIEPSVEAEAEAETKEG